MGLLTKPLSKPKAQTTNLLFTSPIQFGPLKIQSPIYLDTRRLQSSTEMGPRHIQSSDTVEPATCTCQAVFVFTDTFPPWLSRPPAPDGSVHFHGHNNNIIQTQFIYYYIRICLILISAFKYCVNKFG